MTNNQSLWAGAKNMLVFYLLHNVDEFELFRRSLEESSNSPRLRNSLIVVIVENETFKHILPEKPYFLYLTKTDFNFWGKLKNKENKARFDKRYDLLLVYGELKPHFVRLANKAKVQKRVTITEVEGLNYDIRLAPVAKGFNQIAKYTKEILGKIQS